MSRSRVPDTHYESNYITRRDWKMNKYDTMDDYLDNEYGKTKLKRGRWRILFPAVDLAGNAPHELWHQCSKDSWEMEIAQYFCYSEFADRPVIPGWRCEMCYAKAPDTIVGVWALLEPDFTSTEVQDALAAEEERKKYADGRRDNRYDDEMLMEANWANPEADLIDMWTVQEILGGD